MSNLRTWILRESQIGATLDSGGKIALRTIDTRFCFFPRRRRNQTAALYAVRQTNCFSCTSFWLSRRRSTYRYPMDKGRSDDRASRHVMSRNVRHATHVGVSCPKAKALTRPRGVGACIFASIIYDGRMNGNRIVATHSIFSSRTSW